MLQISAAANRLMRLLALVAISSAASLAQPNPAPIPPETGIRFEQISFRYTGITVDNSRWARIIADPNELRNFSGLSRGYINVRTPAGWVVRNMLVDQSEFRTITGPDLSGPDKDGLRPTKYFDLGLSAPQPVQQIQAVVEYLPNPVRTFDQPPVLTYPVFSHVVDAEGGGQGIINEIPQAPPPETFDFKDDDNFSFVQTDTVNVQTADNQCMTMAVANSLQYLENRYGIVIPNDHTIGLKGDNTLVGKLDTLTNRSVTSRTSGSGVWFDPLMKGKFSYLAEANLSNRITTTYQGRGYGGGLLPGGAITGSGSSAEDKGQFVTFDWMCDQLKNGCDVEMVYQHASGGHAVRLVGCGKTRGVRWLKYAHDSAQGFDQFGLEVPQEFLADLDGDGMLNFGNLNQEIVFAVAECPKDEVKQEAGAPPESLTEALVNGASFVAKVGLQVLLAPSTIATAFGINLFGGESGSQQFPSPRLASGVHEAAVPTKLNGTQVFINTRPAPLFFVSPGQVNFQIPAETELGEASVVIAVNGKRTATFSISVGKVGPGIFTNAGRGVIQNQNGTVNTVGNPAAVGEAIVIYVTGIGPVDNPVPTGELAPQSPLARALSTVKVTIGGKEANQFFAGLTPGFAGLAQVNAYVPDLAAGDHKVQITVDGTPSNEVLLAVKR